MKENFNFGKRLFRYCMLLLSNFSFFIAVLLVVSYFHDVLYVMVWKQYFMTFIGIFIASIIIWIGTAFAYILTE